MIEIKSPTAIPESKDIKIFLGGSIEMNTAEDWQDRITKLLNNKPFILLNPRREKWGSNWEQSKDNPDFREQVEWELKALEESNYIVMYFEPDTKSPISLLELGLFAKSGKIFVVCPEGFWRKGNVDIVCEKYNLTQFSTLDALASHLQTLTDN